MNKNTEITQEEAIRQIRDVYDAEVDLENKNFDVFEQLMACESIAEDEAEEQKRTGVTTHNKEEPTERTNGSASVNGSGNATYKRNVNAESTGRKIQVIAELKTCNYQTPPRTVARLLEELFAEHASKEGHWLFVAQHWPPRAINRVIVQMNKQHRTGEESIQNPSAYFTSLIKHRTKRKNKRKGRES